MTNYIVACYMGNRRQQNVDPLSYIKNHIKWLEISKDIDNAIFVFNDSSNIKFNKQEEAIKLVTKAGHNYIIRKNTHFSYGAWEEGIKSIIKEDKYNYSFLIEDDYIPSQEFLIYPFAKHFRYGELNNIKIGFVACFYDNLLSNPNKPLSHAGISNGLISHSAIKETISQNKDIFKLYNRNSNKPPINNDKIWVYNESDKELKSMYGGAVWNQKYFLQNIEKLGYRSTDITEENYTLFYATVGVEKGMHLYGNEDGICLMEPNFQITSDIKDYKSKNYVIKRHNKRSDKKINYDK